MHNNDFDYKKWQLDNAWNLILDTLKQKSVSKFQNEKLSMPGLEIWKSENIQIFF